MKNVRNLIRWLASVMVMLIASAAFASVSKVICVPWQGDTTKYHSTTSGFPVIVKGVIKTTATTAIYYKWVFGDGNETAVSSVSGAMRYSVEATHDYIGSVGAPFTALLVVADNSALSGAISDPYLVQIEDNTLDTRINIAIDNGLWYLYKKGVLSDGATTPFFTTDHSPCMVWTVDSPYLSCHYSSSTASTVQAFEINGSKETGDFDQDPYAEAVHLGLIWLLRGYYSSTTYPMLTSAAIAAIHTPPDNPDLNGNGLGINVYDYYACYAWRPVYEGGMVMDAIIASGTPDADSGRDFSGTLAYGSNWTYRAVIQDMCDMYAWGQSDCAAGFSTDSGSSSGILGGWIYSWNDCYGDNSASQWAAIGMIPAQQSPWSCTVPGWVKTYDDNWLWSSHYKFGTGNIWGNFGYRSPSTGDATTPSGMVQLAFDGKTTADPRWVRCERWFSDNWAAWLGRTAGSSVNLYAVYALTKAMRLAQPSAVVNFSAGDLAGFDWYRGNSSVSGVAKAISDPLVATSHYRDNTWGGDVLGTAWSVIMLKPTLFAAAPIACFTAHPNPTFSDQPVSFDPTCSGHSEPGKGLANLTKFEWDWDNNGTFDLTTTTPDIVTHSFHCATLPCSFPVTLRVTDDSTPPLTATFVLDISITDPPHPPVSKPGGPYVVSLCSGDALTLDGSASYDPDTGLHQSGCDACPNDMITAYDWDLDGAPYTYVNEHGATVSLTSGAAPFTTYFPGAGSYTIALRVTDNTALSYPASGKPNLTDEEFGTLNVYSAGPCTLTATGGCQNVTLTWNTVAGATSYDVSRSTNGPNTGFAVVGSTASLTLTDSVSFGQPYWYRVLAHTAADVTMSPAVMVTDTYQNCYCITGLKPYAKNLLVELDWTAVAGASCYNVYRSTSPGVALTAANRIAACVGTPYTVFVDNHVVNGTKYYYVLTEVAGGVEVCRSVEVNGTPAAPRR